MEFDSMDDFSGCNDHLIIIKGHRTKRPRPPSPVSRSVTVSGEGSSGLISNAPPSFTMCSDDDHSNETTESTIEDEIMANCLMYLAQSGGCIRQEEVKLAKKRFNEVVSDDSRTEMKGGLFVYECKTCNRNFPSFQALGGHRASHKRPKITVQEDKKAIFTTSSQNLEEEEEEEIGGKFKKLSDDNISPEFTIKLSQKVTVGNQQAKIHECSFCGSEFSSGQALGGHMRRHRNSANAAKVNSNTNIAVDTEKPRRVFQLDLNLPAPEDDHRDLKFQFQATASSALVDCHY